LAGTLHASECLVALRPWQQSQRGALRDLASVITAAGLRVVPADPYDGKPMPLALVQGQSVIDSVS
jgi:hypothetical protein